MQKTGETNNSEKSPMQRRHETKKKKKSERNQYAEQKHRLLLEGVRLSCMNFGN